jgi:hypothetical protein
MAEISIEIVTNYDTRLTYLLESLRKQTFQEYETVISASDNLVKDIVVNFDAKLVINENTETLYRRIVAHDTSASKKSLLLESSRFLEENALGKLVNATGDLGIIMERDVGNNIISKIQNIERSGDLSNHDNINPGFLVAEPRYFSSDVLGAAMLQIRKIPLEILKRIQWGDLDIIYSETYKISKSIEVIDIPLIFHFSDDNLLDLVKKYYRYGVNSRYLRNTIYRDRFRARNHYRPYLGIKSTVAVYSLLAVKAASFAIGAYL